MRRADVIMYVGQSAELVGVFLDGGVDIRPPGDLMRTSMNSGICRSFLP